MGGSFTLQPPRMLDKDDFNRWARGLDNIESWVQVELDELEQVHMAEVNLTCARRFGESFLTGSASNGSYSVMCVG